MEVQGRCARLEWMTGMAPTETLPKDQDSWNILLDLDPETATVRYTYKSRTDVSPPADDDWSI